jgi:hypothetical protein
MWHGFTSVTTGAVTFMVVLLAGMAVPAVIRRRPKVFITPHLP